MMTYRILRMLGKGESIMAKTTDSLETAARLYLDNLEGHTRRNYTYDFFNQTTGLLVILASKHLPPNSSITTLKEEFGLEWIQHLKRAGCAPATIARRISAFKNFLRYCALRYRLPVDSNRFAEMLKDAQLRPKVYNLKDVPMRKIETLIAYCENKGQISSMKLEPLQLLREVRNRTFLIVLADTGIRVDEAMKLNRDHGEIDWWENKTIIVGKGGRHRVVRFSDRAMGMISWLQLLEHTHKINPGKSPTPLFGSYAKKGIKRLTTESGRDFVHALCTAALGSDYMDGEITPHSMRHYFVIHILRVTGGDIKKAKELVGHASIGTTDRYAQLEDSRLDSAYKEIFNSKHKENQQ